MRFFLGSHRPNWLGQLSGVPLFVSRRTLYTRKTFPQATTTWALDSGGFTEVAMYGGWTLSAREYANEVERYATEIGHMEWAAPQDWMVEPWVLEKTGLTVEEHQFRTTENYLELRTIAPHLPFIPVLQGWTLQEYRNHAQMYAGYGIDLSSLPLVGIGSVCRRQQTQGGREVIEHFASQGLRLHAFGLKLNGLREVGYLLESSDSLAWSYAARRSPPLPGCTHKACANCMRFALRWREKVLRALEVQQPTLWSASTDRSPVATP